MTSVIFVVILKSAEESRFPWVQQDGGAIEGTKNTGGHEDDLLLTLPLCSNEIRNLWKV